jgi:hypothetical protein
VNTWVWIVFAVVVAIVVVGVIASALRTRRSRLLQERFEVHDGGDDAPLRDREVEEVRAHDNVERLR